MTNQHNTLFILVVYMICGVLHEAAHILVASLYYNQLPEFGVSIILQAIFGRYSVIQLSSEEHHDIIRHAGWIFSVLLAIVCHLLHNYKRTTKKDPAVAFMRTKYRCPKSIDSLRISSQVKILYKYFETQYTRQ